MCNLYSITTNQAAIRDLFKATRDSTGNLPPMPGVFPDYPAPVVRNANGERELIMMRWGMPPPPKFGGPPVTNIWRRYRELFSCGKQRFDHARIGIESFI
jgi:putative SOS response-associated peptidase YedK